MNTPSNCWQLLQAFEMTQYNSCTINSENDWKMLNIFARFTELQKPDSLQFYIYNTSKNEMWLDDLHILTRKVTYEHETVEFDIF